jgi:hypothetical protein
MNRRTAEQGTAECRSEECCLILLKKLQLFEIPCSIFDILNAKLAKSRSKRGWKAKVLNLANGKIKVI